MSDAQVVLFGIGEMASLARFYFEHDSAYDVAGFVVDDEFAQAENFEGLPLVALSDVTEKFPPEDFRMFVALSYRELNQVREARYRTLKEKGYQLVSYISSKATTWPDLITGDNCFILEDQTIQPRVKLGNNVMLWSGNHIGHGTVIGDHTYLSSQITVSGHCEFGQRCFVGVNASFRDFCEVGDDVFVGMGANVTQDIADGSVVVAKGSEIYSADDRRAKALKRQYFRLKT